MSDEDGSVVPVVTGNAAKYERYARAHERLKLALESGFHIEAAMICESILADRLHSHVHWRVTEAQTLSAEALPETLRLKLTFDQPMNFSALVRIIKLDFDPLERDAYHKLPSRLLGWARQRNKVAHGSVFTYPAHKTYDEDYATFCALQAECSTTGLLLVRQVTNWDRLHRSTHRQRNRP